MEETYRLKKISGGVAHWAEVTIRVEQADRPEVVVSDDVFGWRRSVYGPDAWIGGPWDQELAEAASAGVRYVLDRIGDRRTRVIIEAVRDSPVDTVPLDVQFAAAAATCSALNVVLDPPPTIERRNVVFPA